MSADLAQMQHEAKEHALKELQNAFRSQKRRTNRDRWEHGQHHNRSKRANFGRLGRPAMRWSA